MKRSFVFTAFILICALLSSCAAPIAIMPAPAIDKPFSASVEINFGNDNCKAQIKRFSDESWEFCITEPYALEGLLVTIRDGETKLSMYGLEGFADFFDEAVSVPQLIADAIDAAKNGTVSKNADEITISGESVSSRYTLTVDSAGKPDSLVLTGKGISVKISDFIDLPITEQAEQEADVPFVTIE